MTATLTIEDLFIPVGFVDLDAFRAWAISLGEDAPRVHFYRGNARIEMSPQNYDTHLAVVTEFTSRLHRLARDLDLGEYYSDGGLVTCEAADLSTEPDGFLVLWETFRSGEATLVPRPGGARGSVELTGRGDVVLEVISDSSVRKDTVENREAYARAGFREYWLVDARGEALEFRILLLQQGAYVDQQPDEALWLHSPVWGRSFRLERGSNPVGGVRYDLRIRLDGPR